MTTSIYEVDTTFQTLKSALPASYYIILDAILKGKHSFPHVTKETEAWGC